MQCKRSVSSCKYNGDAVSIVAGTQQIQVSSLELSEIYLFIYFLIFSTCRPRGYGGRTVPCLIYSALYEQGIPWFKEVRRSNCPLKFFPILGLTVPVQSVERKALTRCAF